MRGVGPRDVPHFRLGASVSAETRSARCDMPPKMGSAQRSRWLQAYGTCTSAALPRGTIGSRRGDAALTGRNASGRNTGGFSTQTKTLAGLLISAFVVGAVPALADTALLAVVGTTTMGKAMVDTDGMALCAYDKDTVGKLLCNGDCAKEWPP